MWKRISLRSRILILLSALVLITVGGGLVSVWHTYMMEKSLTEVLDSHLPSLLAAKELKSALVMQKGYVTYFFQDGDPEWIKQLEDYHVTFESWLRKARRLALTDKQREILDEIQHQYIRYSHGREKVIDLYKAGARPKGFKLQKSIRPQFYQIIELCSQFEEGHEKAIAQARTKSREQAQVINRMTLIALIVAMVCGLILAYTMSAQVFAPIRKLAGGDDGSQTRQHIRDEMKALSFRFDNLIRDFDQTKSKLEWSREHLQQAEKWALVGKLAAGVAHSVRNPLTAVKMRLFSLERSLTFGPSQKDDFEVISEEIRHIDGIVNNFLEFSRPPKLKKRLTSPSEAVDLAIQLLRHRLESYNVTLEVTRDGLLPQTPIDTEQLKEVFVNLVINACEAMVDGGAILIEEEMGQSEDVGPIIVIKISDNGPGVPVTLRSKIFQPFYSTKEEGTGLGLSIAMRIVDEHGGWLDVDSIEGGGAVFTITLPIMEAEDWV